MAKAKSLWTIKTTLDADYLQKETEKLAKEANRLKELILVILRKYPDGITEDALLHELPENEDHEAVRNILPILATEQSVTKTDGHC
jgi:hypothetical protein